MKNLSEMCPGQAQAFKLYWLLLDNLLYGKKIIKMDINMMEIRKKRVW